MKLREEDEVVLGRRQTSRRLWQAKCERVARSWKRQRQNEMNEWRGDFLQVNKFEEGFAKRPARKLFWARGSTKYTFYVVRF
jgi:hypothetical protein